MKTKTLIDFLNYLNDNNIPIRSDEALLAFQIVLANEFGQDGDLVLAEEKIYHLRNVLKGSN